MAPHEPGGRSLVRDVEAWLISLREAYGEDLVVDPEGSAPAVPARTAGRDPRPPPSLGPRLPAGSRGAVPDPNCGLLGGEAPSPFGASPRFAPPEPRHEGRGSAAKADRESPLRSPPRLRAGPADHVPAQRAAAADRSWLRRLRAAEPGVIDFHPAEDIVRGPATRTCAPRISPRWMPRSRSVNAACATRTRTVFGVGNPCARGLRRRGSRGREDRRGEPFVGRPASSWIGSSRR